MGTGVQNFDLFLTPEQSDESLDSLSSYFINRTSSLDVPPNEPNVVALNFASKNNDNDDKEFAETLPEVCIGDTNSWVMNRTSNNKWIDQESRQDNEFEVYSNGSNYDENGNDMVIKIKPVFKSDQRPKENSLTNYKA